MSQPTDAGVAGVLLGLAADQVRRGCEVHVACPPGPGDLAQAAARAGARVHPWQATRSPALGTWSEATRLGGIVRQVSPDVLHLHSSKAGLAGRLATRGRTPTVFQPHAWSFDAVTGPVRTASLAWERLAARWTTLTLCVSTDEARRGEAAGCLADRWVVIRNGIDVDHWVPHDQTSARVRLGLPENAPIAVLVGRLTPQKGQDIAVQAWPEVRRSLPTAQLYLVGDGPQRAALEAAAVDGVHLTGPSDPTDWYAAADLVLVPSRWEGMPLVVLEAMSCGRALLGADVTGVAEAVDDPAQIVAAQRPDLLAEATVRMLSDRPGTRRIGLRNRETAVTGRVAGAMFEAVMLAYENL